MSNYMLTKYPPMVYDVVNPHPGGHTGGSIMVFKVTEEAKKELINSLETRQNPSLNFRVFVRGIG
jgi:hypothetical protein